MPVAEVAAKYKQLLQAREALAAEATAATVSQDQTGQMVLVAEVAVAVSFLILLEVKAAPVS